MWKRGSLVPVLREMLLMFLMPYPPLFVGSIVLTIAVCFVLTKETD
jgi:hypothetical protein